MIISKHVQFVGLVGQRDGQDGEVTASLAVAGLVLERTD